MCVCVCEGVKIERCCDGFFFWQGRLLLRLPILVIRVPVRTVALVLLCLLVISHAPALLASLDLCVVWT